MRDENATQVQKSFNTHTSLCTLKINMIRSRALYQTNCILIANGMKPFQSERVQSAGSSILVQMRTVALSVLWVFFTFEKIKADIWCMGMYSSCSLSLSRDLSIFPLLVFSQNQTSKINCCEWKYYKYTGVWTGRFPASATMLLAFCWIVRLLCKVQHSVEWWDCCAPMLFFDPKLKFNSLWESIFICRNLMILPTHRNKHFRGNRK